MMADYKFELSIQMGNDGMKEGPDFAKALRDVADRIENGLETSGNIYDVNGNSVGIYQWKGSFVY